jgi:hypothetical protein
LEINCREETERRREEKRREEEEVTVERRGEINLSLVYGKLRCCCT